MRKLTSFRIDQEIYDTIKLKHINMSDLINFLLHNHFQEKDNDLDKLHFELKEEYNKLELLKTKIKIIEKAIREKEEEERNIKREELFNKHENKWNVDY